MPSALKSYLTEKFGLATDADEAAEKALASDKLKSGDLTLDKYEELKSSKVENPKDPADAIAEKLANRLSPIFDNLAKALTPKAPAAPLPDDNADPDVPDREGEADLLKRLEDQFRKKHAHLFDENGKGIGGDGASLMKMGCEYNQTENSPENLRVKNAVERYSHTPTALTYKGRVAKQMGMEGMPIQYNGKDVNVSTERSKMMSAVWLKFQLFPEQITESEADVIRYILNREKFNVPNKDNDTQAKGLSADQRAAVWEFNKNFYRDTEFSKAVINDSTSGGENAIPEFFDYDMIVSPTLADENLMQYCHVIPVPRGTAAQNFHMGRPTITAANTEGSGVSLFTTTGFITAKDRTFFRAAGFIEIGRNFAQDAHPGLVPEIQRQYGNSVKLWFNEQIAGGDGTTEPQGVMVASSTINVTPTTPSTGPILLADVLEMLFAVPKAYRYNGPQKSIFVMRDLTYSRIRSIATGVTGDTRLVFGMGVEDYSLFGHPVIIEEQAMQNDWMFHAQMAGYRMYLRQGARFVREDRGKTLVLANTFIVGVDVRAGGGLDEGSYAAVATGFPT